MTLGVLEINTGSASFSVTVADYEMTATDEDLTFRLCLQHYGRLDILATCQLDRLTIFRVIRSHLS